MPRVTVVLVSGFLVAALAACAGSASTSSGVPASTSAGPSAAAPASAIASAAISAVPSGGPTISLSEWKVVVPDTIKSGKTTFTINNVGTTPHELLVFRSDLDPSAYPTNAGGDIDEAGAGVKLVSDGENIDAGGSQSRSIDLPPGKYLFVCNIPGHFKQGMFVAVTIAAS